MNTTLLYQRKHRADRTFRRHTDSPAVINNKLEALKTLASSIVSEVTSLKQNGEAVSQDKLDLADEVQRYETGLIRSALVRAGGNQRQAARLLNVKPTTLHEKLKRYGILQYEPVENDLPEADDEESSEEIE